MRKKDGTHTGNKLIATRLPKEVEQSLKEGMKLTGLLQPSFVRAAIVEKTERERIRVEK